MRTFTRNVKSIKDFVDGFLYAEAIGSGVEVDTNKLALILKDWCSPTGLSYWTPESFNETMSVLDMVSRNFIDISLDDLRLRLDVIRKSVFPAHHVTGEPVKAKRTRRPKDVVVDTDEK